MVRSELTADDSLAAMRARSRFGMAIAAIIRIIATTINNSISEKPFSFRISFSPLLPLASVVSIDPIREHLRSLRPKSEVTKEFDTFRDTLPPCIARFGMEIYGQFWLGC